MSFWDKAGQRTYIIFLKS